MKYLKAGFSLVELMVVIAIVAILAAVAIPAYKDYVFRARIVEIINVMEANKNYINEYISRKGTVPPASAYTPTGASIYGTYKWEGQYGLSFNFNTVLHTPSPPGYVDAIYLRPHPGNNAATIIWKCSVWAGIANSLSAYVPPTCQQDDTWDYPEG